MVQAASSPYCDVFIAIVLFLCVVLPLEVCHGLKGDAVGRRMSKEWGEWNRRVSVGFLGGIRTSKRWRSFTLPIVPSGKSPCRSLSRSFPASCGISCLHKGPGILVGVRTYGPSRSRFVQSRLYSLDPESLLDLNDGESPSKGEGQHLIDSEDGSADLIGADEQGSQLPQNANDDLERLAVFCALFSRSPCPLKEAHLVRLAIGEMIKIYSEYKEDAGRLLKMRRAIVVSGGSREGPTLISQKVCEIFELTDKRIGDIISAAVAASVPSSEVRAIHRQLTSISDVQRGILPLGENSRHKAECHLTILRAITREGNWTGAVEYVNRLQRTAPSLLRSEMFDTSIALCISKQQYAIAQDLYVNSKKLFPPTATRSRMMMWCVRGMAGRWHTDVFNKGSAQSQSSLFVLEELFAEVSSHLRSERANGFRSEVGPHATIMDICAETHVYAELEQLDMLTESWRELHGAISDLPNRISSATPALCETSDKSLPTFESLTEVKQLLERSTVDVVHEAALVSLRCLERAGGEEVLEILMNTINHSIFQNVGSDNSNRTEKIDCIKLAATHVFWRILLKRIRLLSGLQTRSPAIERIFNLAVKGMNWQSRNSDVHLLELNTIIKLLKLLSINGSDSLPKTRLQARVHSLIIDQVDCVPLSYLLHMEHLSTEKLMLYLKKVCAPRFPSNAQNPTDCPTEVSARSATLMNKEEDADIEDVRDFLNKIGKVKLSNVPKDDMFMTQIELVSKFVLPFISSDTLCKRRDVLSRMDHLKTRTEILTSYCENIYQKLTDRIRSKNGQIAYPPNRPRVNNTMTGLNHGTLEPVKIGPIATTVMQAESKEAPQFESLFNSLSTRIAELSVGLSTDAGFLLLYTILDHPHTDDQNALPNAKHISNKVRVEELSKLFASSLKYVAKTQSYSEICSAQIVGPDSSKNVNALTNLSRLRLLSIELLARSEGNLQRMSPNLGRSPEILDLDSSESNWVQDAHPHVSSGGRYSIARVITLFSQLKRYHQNGVTASLGMDIRKLLALLIQKKWNFQSSRSTPTECARLFQELSTFPLGPPEVSTIVLLLLIEMSGRRDVHNRFKLLLGMLKAHRYTDLLNQRTGGRMNQTPRMQLVSALEGTPPVSRPFNAKIHDSPPAIENLTTEGVISYADIISSELRSSQGTSLTADLFEKHLRSEERRQVPIMNSPSANSHILRQALSKPSVGFKKGDQYTTQKFNHNPDSVAPPIQPQRSPLSEHTVPTMEKGGKDFSELYYGQGETVSPIPNLKEFRPNLANTIVKCLPHHCKGLQLNLAMRSLYEEKSAAHEKTDESLFDRTGEILQGACCEYLNRMRSSSVSRIDVQLVYIIFALNTYKTNPSGALKFLSDAKRYFASSEGGIGRNRILRIFQELGMPWFEESVVDWPVRGGESKLLPEYPLNEQYLLNCSEAFQWILELQQSKDPRAKAEGLKKLNANMASVKTLPYFLTETMLTELITCLAHKFYSRETLTIIANTMHNYAAAGRADDLYVHLDFLAKSKGAEHHFLFNIGLKACYLTRKPELGLKIFDAMRKNGVSPNVVSHNYLMGAYLKAGQYSSAFSVYQKMKTEGPPPNMITFTHAFRCCSHFSKHTRSGWVMDILQDFTVSGQKPDRIAYNTILGVLAEIGDISSTGHVFGRMTDIDAVDPNALTFTHLLYAGTQANSPLSVQYAMDQKKLHQLPLIAEDINYLIKALDSSGATTQQILGVYKNMKSEGPSPNTKTFLLIFQHLGRNPCPPDELRSVLYDYCRLLSENLVPDFLPSQLFVWNVEGCEDQVNTNRTPKADWEQNKKREPRLRRGETSGDIFSAAMIASNAAKEWTLTVWFYAVFQLLSKELEEHDLLLPKHGCAALHRAIENLPDYEKRRSWLCKREPHFRTFKRPRHASAHDIDTLSPHSSADRNVNKPIGHQSGAFRTVPYSESDIPFPPQSGTNGGHFPDQSPSVEILQQALTIERPADQLTYKSDFSQPSQTRRSQPRETPVKAREVLWQNFKRAEDLNQAIEAAKRLLRLPNEGVQLWTKDYVAIVRELVGRGGRLESVQYVLRSAAFHLKKRRTHNKASVSPVENSTKRDTDSTVLHHLAVNLFHGAIEEAAVNSDWRLAKFFLNYVRCTYGEPELGLTLRVMELSANLKQPRAVLEEYNFIKDREEAHGNDRVYSSVLRACASAGLWQKSIGIVIQVLRQQEDVPHKWWQLCIAACQNAKEIDGASMLKTLAKRLHKTVVPKQRDDFIRRGYLHLREDEIDGLYERSRRPSNFFVRQRLAEILGEKVERSAQFCRDDLDSEPPVDNDLNHWYRHSCVSLGVRHTVWTARE